MGSCKDRAVPGIPGAVARRVDGLPERLPDSIRYSPIGEVAGRTFLLHAPGIGRFLVRDGDTIEYQPEHDASAVAVDRFLWGAARSALIHQRGELPLHASCVVRPNGGALALCGPSGSGKSSTAAALVQQGWTALADDLVRIEPSQQQVFVWPGQTFMRLYPDACAALTIDTAGREWDEEDRQKVLVELPFAEGRHRLRTIVELGGSEATPRLELLRGGESMAVLSRHVVGPRKMGALISRQEHLSMVTQIADRVSVARLHGRKTAPAKALAELLHTLAGTGSIY